MNMLEELKRRGYSTKVCGTWYLKTAAELIREAGRPLMMTKEVYPAIARMMQTSPVAIERSIRTSIGKAEPGRTNAEVARELALGMESHED